MMTTCPEKVLSNCAAVKGPEPLAVLAARAACALEKSIQRLVLASDENLGKPWTLLSGGNAIFTMPRAAVLRSMILNHTIHHRAQLGVYLRLNNVPVPATYGPSADEGTM